MATLGTAATALSAAAFLAVLIERLTEFYFGPLFEALFGAIAAALKATVETGKILPYVSGLLGLALCLFFEIDLIGLTLSGLGWETSSTWAGEALTGLLVGGGSNLLHDIWPGNGDDGTN